MIDWSFDLDHRSRSRHLWLWAQVKTSFVLLYHVSDYGQWLLGQADKSFRQRVTERHHQQPAELADIWRTWNRWRLDQAADGPGPRERSVIRKSTKIERQMCFERDRRSLSPGSCSPSCLVSFVFSLVEYFTLYFFRHISNLNSIIILNLVLPQPVSPSHSFAAKALNVSSFHFSILFIYY